MRNVKIEWTFILLVCLLGTGLMIWPDLMQRARWDFDILGHDLIVFTTPTVFFAIAYSFVMYSVYVLIRRRYGFIPPFIAVSHVIATTIFILLLIFGNFFVHHFNDPEGAGAPRYYFDWTGAPLYAYYRYSSPINKIIMLLFFPFLIAQCIFWVYVFRKLFLSPKKLLA